MSRGDYRPSRVLDGVGVYVAGRSEDVSRVRRVQRMVWVRGGHITFDWTGAEGQIGHEWSPTPQAKRQLAQRRRGGAIAARLTIVCWRSHGACSGLLEAGIALAHRRRLIVLGDASESVFWHLPTVTRLVDEHQLAAALDRWPATPDRREAA